MADQRTILVVDDDASIRSLLKLMLRGAGYEVLEAMHGGIALDIVHSQPVDLVLLDLIMPEREGLETIRALRKLSATLPIIAMSGMDEGACLRIASALGANSTLRKPFARKSVLETVGAVLEQSGGGSRNRTDE